MDVYSHKLKTEVGIVAKYHRYQKWVFMLLLFAGFLLITSCAGTRGYSTPPVTVPEIIKMSKEGVPAQTIISKMRKSHTVYRLKAEQLAQLKQEGVAGPVINYMQNTYLKSVERNQQLEDWSYWWPGWDGYWYGGPAFGWPYDYWDWNWGPDVDFGDED
jgi:hypothetical protein